MTEQTTGGALRLWRIGRRAATRMIDEDGLMVAGYLSFSGLLAFFPFLIFVAALLSFFGSEADLQRIVGLMFDSMPDEVASTLAPAVAEVVVGRRADFLSFSALFMLWAASDGIEGLRLAFNRAYRVEQLRPFWLRRLQSLFFVVLTSLLALLLSFTIVLGPLLWSLATRYVELGIGTRLVWTAGRYTVAVGALLIVLQVLHRWLPNSERHGRPVLPGVLLTVALVTLGSTLFSLYLSTYANYSITYGSMASVVIALVFFNLTAAIAIYGAYFNAALEESRRLDDGARPSPS